MKNNQSNYKYQISGIEPNYSYNQTQNLAFDQSAISTSGYSNRDKLAMGIREQQNFINNNNNFKPTNSFNVSSNTNTAFNENLTDYSQYNINKGFSTNKPIQLMPSNENKHTTLYDNLNDNLLRESLKEYRLNIDSSDRNIELYPDPFNYVIHLGPVSNSGINATSISKTSIKQELKSLGKKNKKNKSDNSNIHEEIFSNEIKDVFNNKIFLFDNPDAIKKYTINLEKSFNPYIIRDFDNISWIKLDCAVVPKYNSICINSQWDYCRKHTHKKKFIRDEYDRQKDYILLNQRYIPNDTNDYNPLGDRFIQIFIKELQSLRNFGTNAITDKSFILIYDKTLGALYLKLIPYSASKFYKDSLLGNLTRLSIQFYDSWGNPLKINTDCIDYEKNQLANTKILNPEYCDFSELFTFLTSMQNFNTNSNEKSNENFIEFIKNFNEIIKCFITINYDIEYIIPFYNSFNYDDSLTLSTNNIDSNTNSNTNLKFNVNCANPKQIQLNTTIFNIDNIYEEFDNFIDIKTNGFVEKIKISKSKRKIKLGINEFINNVIWFNFDFAFKEQILFNLKSLLDNYIGFGFNILDSLKNEIANIPVNKNFQNFLTFLVGIWENELNTKIEYSN